MAIVKSMASRGVPGALRRRYENLQHKLRVGGLADDLEPCDSGGGARLPIAERYSAGRKKSPKIPSLQPTGSIPGRALRKGDRDLDDNEATQFVRQAVNDRCRVYRQHLNWRG